MNVEIDELENRRIIEKYAESNILFLEPIKYLNM